MKSLLIICSLLEQVLGDILPKISEIVVPLIEDNLKHWETLQKAEQKS